MPNPPPLQIRFVDRSTPRAKPIPRAKWNEYKDELCLLYQSMTLEDLMAYMKIQYAFEASPRQYIYQFEKWDVKKYNTRGRNSGQLPPATSHT